MGQAIERDTVEEVLGILSEVAPRAAVGLECGDKWATNRLSPVAQWRIKETGIWPFLVGDLALCLNQAIYQLWVDAAPDQLEALRNKLDGYNLAIMHYTDPHRLRLRSAAASRGWALSALASQLEVPQHQVMAIGDGGLDRSMLQAAAFAAVISGMETGSDLPEGPAEMATAAGVAEALQRYLVPGS
jgi:hydroxymethylpyrimidine pyrophosphatase-like HAD family hydrolase